MKKVLSLVLALALVLGVMSFASAEDAKIKLVVWSFTPEFQGMVEKYYAPNHPEIEFTFDMTPTAEYPGKVDNLMASAGDSEEAPDIFTLEAAFVKKYVSSDWTADLKEVGFTDEELAAAIPVMAQIGQNEAGVQKGLSWQSTPGALFYRASLAEKYLGVTTPEEFQALVSDWDTFLETAEKLKEASEGKCKMVTGSGDIWNPYKYQRTQGWVVDGKLVIDPELEDYLDLCKTMEEDDLTYKGDSWSEIWYAGMRGENETMCYFLPTWGLHYTIKPNCVAGGDSAANDEELAKLSEEKGGTFGDWRMVAGPCGYSWGGTWVAANAMKVAAADDAKKAAIKDVIKFFTLDVDFLVQYAQDTGDFVGSTEAVKKIIENGGTPNPFLGGQDHYAMFAEAAALANGSTMTKYDADMEDMWGKQVTGPYTKDGADKDECLQNFKDKVKEAFTDIVVE
jgi:hypothetical protein